MPTLYTHVAIVECGETDKLQELLAAGLSRFVVRQLGEGAVVVDHTRLADIHRLFKRLGQTPRISTGQ